MSLFSRMGTQWRVGFAGPVGLDMNVFPLYARALRVPRNLRDQVFDDLHVLERAALKAMQENK